MSSAAVAAVMASILGAGCGRSSASSAVQPALGFGTLPGFLPRTTQPVDRVVTASAGRPQLAIQGVPVDVVLPAGHVQATVSGPAVPPFVVPPPPAVTAVFTVVLTHADGTVPLRLSDFSITDQLGQTFAPSLVEGEAVPPATVRYGSTVTFEVAAVVPTGEGVLHWSPGSRHPIVSWDFVVEDD